MSESLPRLRADAQWWFTNSSGETRIVLVIGIPKISRTIIVEKWQLTPAGPDSFQQAYCAQEVNISVDDAGVVTASAPLVIPFYALMDRNPMGNEGDVDMNVNVLMTWARYLF